MLRVENISCRYGALDALRDISINVSENEFVALIGGNGAGKTSVLRCISGIITPFRGEIAFEGHRIDGKSPAEIVRLGIAHSPEERKIWPRLSVYEHLRLGAYLRNDTAGIRADIDRICTIFPKLAERRDQLCGTLSGGEQQMVAIGRALMSRPKLLLLDEPSLGLAPMAVEQTMNTIRQLHRDGVTIVIVEQSAAVVLQHADRAYVLENGMIIHQGVASELLRDETVQRAYLGKIEGTSRS
jgi:branched-chain amino acid transport system ATP-binding protein